MWAFAGLWERWEGPGGPVESCAILTTEADELVRPVHVRMRVILPERYRTAWLGRDAQGAAALVPLLRPYLADAMRVCPVGPLVSNPRKDVPEFLTPAQAANALPADLQITPASGAFSLRPSPTPEWRRPVLGPARLPADALGSHVQCLMNGIDERQTNRGRDLVPDALR